MTSSPRRARREQGPPDEFAPEPQRTVSVNATPREAPDVGPWTTVKPLRRVGTGFRWYDMPYNFLRFLDYGRVPSQLPARLRSKIRDAHNTLYQTHYVRELRHVRKHGGRVYSWDKISLPKDEAVTLPSVWVTEYFPASGVHRLIDRIRSAGWDGSRFLGTDPGGVTSVQASRSGQGRTWWQIASLISMTSSRSASTDVFRARLPIGVNSVTLTGVSIGRGITAVVVEFHLTPEVSEGFNTVLRAPYKPEVIRRPGMKATGQGVGPVLHYHAQSARAELHRRLRLWTSETLSGAFSNARAPQPLVDLVFFAVGDPDHIEPGAGHRENDALRAVGVNDLSPYRTSSTELPGLVLEWPQRMDWAPDIGENVWTLWGNISAAPGLAWGTGGQSTSDAAYRVGDQTTDYFARSGLTALLQLMRKQASTAHDNARTLHGGTSSRELKRLRERTLTTSLDFATLEADVRSYNAPRRRDREPHFLMDLAPSFRKSYDENGEREFEPIDLNAYDRKQQKKLARELVAFDADYREVLSTVAALGASLDSRRVQRIAIWVSVASLAVAVVTLWATSESRLPFLREAGQWLLRVVGLA